MTKSELVEVIAEKQGNITRREAEVVINTIFSAIGDALADGDRVELRGFGSFTIKQRNARIGRNPKTGESVRVPAKVVPHFKPGKELRERVDAGFAARNRSSSGEAASAGAAMAEAALLVAERKPA